jgi:hypothetical protein
MKTKILTATKIASLAATIFVLAGCFGARAVGAPSGGSTAYRLPPENEFLAITVGVEGDAFVVVQHVDSLGGIVGVPVFRVEPGGAIEELPVTVPPGAPVGLAGIAPAGPGSIWIPTAHGVDRVGGEGLEAEVSFGREEVDDLTTDHEGGVWVLASSHLIHVDASGGVRRFAPGFHARLCCVLARQVVVDHRGDVWFTVVRGFAQLVKEVVERSPDGTVHHVRLSTPVPRSFTIGIDSTRMVVQSGFGFFKVDFDSGRARRVPVPGRHCLTTETAEIWCQGRRSLFRVLPRAVGLATRLPRPGFLVSDLVTGPLGERWYVAGGRGIVVGELPLPEGRP